MSLKFKTMHRKLITIAVLALVSLGADARRKTEKPPFELKRHEFSVGIAAHSVQALFGRDFNLWRSNGLFGGGRWVESLTDSYFQASTYETGYATPFLSVNYLYNINTHWALGAFFSHESATQSFYDNLSGDRVIKETLNYITPMFQVRAAWLNRPYVRMYTSWALGMTMIPKTRYAARTEILPAFQFNPIGISAGKKLFGFAEIGIGTNYFGGTCGIGYRF